MVVGGRTGPCKKAAARLGMRLEQLYGARNEKETCLPESQPSVTPEGPDSVSGYLPLTQRGGRGETWIH